MSMIQPYRIKYLIEYIWDHASVDIWNALAKWIQVQKIKSNTIQSNATNRIQVSDRELEFHPEPNSDKIEHTMKQIIQQI